MIIDVYDITITIYDHNYLNYKILKSFANPLRCKSIQGVKQKRKDKICIIQIKLFCNILSQLNIIQCRTAKREAKTGKKKLL